MKNTRTTLKVMFAATAAVAILTGCGAGSSTTSTTTTNAPEFTMSHGSTMHITASGMGGLSEVSIKAPHPVTELQLRSSKDISGRNIHSAADLTYDDVDLATNINAVIQCADNAGEAQYNGIPVCEDIATLVCDGQWENKTYTTLYSFSCWPENYSHLAVTVTVETADGLGEEKIVVPVLTGYDANGGVSRTFSDGPVTKFLSSN